MQRLHSRRDRRDDVGTSNCPQKIAFAEMREQGVRGILIYGADYHCNHSQATSGDHWPDDLRLTLVFSWQPQRNRDRRARSTSSSRVTTISDRVGEPGQRIRDRRAHVRPNALSHCRSSVSISSGMDGAPGVSSAVDR